MKVSHTVQLNFKKTNYEYIHSMNYTVYNGWERVWTFKSGLYFAISIDSKIVSEDASLAKPTMLKLSWDKGWLVSSEWLRIRLCSGREIGLVVKIDSPMCSSLLALKDLVVEPIYRELHPDTSYYLFKNTFSSWKSY